MSWVSRLLGERAPSAARGDAALEGLLRAGAQSEARRELAEADRCYRQALELKPGDGEILFALGRIAEFDRRNEEAISLYREAAATRPEDRSIAFALGAMLLESRRFKEAEEVCAAGLKLDPEHHLMRSNYAGALIEQGRREEALPHLERLREQLPDGQASAYVNFNLGGIYREYGRIEEAIEAYRHTLRLFPGRSEPFSNLLLTLNYSERVTAEEIFLEHCRWGARFSVPYAAPEFDRTWPRRLRLGYVSPDFRSHVVSFFIEPILANHDRARFEVFCYHTHLEKDHVTEALRRLVPNWRDCDGLIPAELAERIRADRIDILVDIVGHTDGTALPAFALKPAPVQATYLGYPNTSGLGAVDYRITDAVADPPGEADGLSVERLVRLPGSYFCYRPRIAANPPGALPALSRGVVTFGCFNGFIKISDIFLDAVANVLSAVPRSRFLLKGRPLSIGHVADRVREKFARAGIDPARIELRGWTSSPSAHLEVYQELDIALDSFPYNGATTTCEALWMGVPVVTHTWDRHAGRAAASILGAVGLADCVAHDSGEYVAIAARLAGDLERLAGLRAGLRERMRSSPLMQEAQFVRRLEQAYVRMWESKLARRSALAPAPAGARDELLARARSARSEGKLVDARAACAELLSHYPAHRDALALFWDIAFDADMPGAAIDALVRAIELEPREARFRYMLGCSLQFSGNSAAAIDAYRRAVELDPALAKASNNLGCLLEAAGDIDQATRCYRRALEADPSLAEARSNLSALDERVAARRGQE